MTIVNSMTDVSIAESLGISLLGLIVVFLVLVFLMAIIYIMTAIIRKTSSKPVAVGETSATDAPAPSEAPPVDQAAAAPAAVAQAPAVAAPDEQAAAPAAPTPSIPRKYRVIVNGMEYEVDAETGDAAASLAASEPEAPEAPVDTAAADTPAVLSSAQASTIEFSGTRKFKVVVDGKEYEVDAEMGDAANKSDAGRAQ